MNEPIRVPYPFVRCVAQTWDEDGPSEFVSWRPGVDHQYVSPDGDTESFANGMGEMELTVVGSYRPGRFPERVFYTRQWVDPEGRRFGKGGCFVATRAKFSRLCRGYGHAYELEPTALPDDVKRLAPEPDQ